MTTTIRFCRDGARLLAIVFVYTHERGFDCAVAHVHGWCRARPWCALEAADFTRPLGAWPQGGGVT